MTASARGGWARTWLLIVAVALALVYEAWAALTHKALTISQMCWRVSKDHPIVPFLAGLLCGHLFWRG